MDSSPTRQIPIQKSSNIEASIAWVIMEMATRAIRTARINNGLETILENSTLIEVVAQEMMG